MLASPPPITSHEESPLAGVVASVAPLPVTSVTFTLLNLSVVPASTFARLNINCIVSEFAVKLPVNVLFPADNAWFVNSV